MSARRHPELGNLIVFDHPLLAHKITLLRDTETGKKLFKELVDEVAMLMAYEVTADMPSEPREVETPLERTGGIRVPGQRITLVPVLRAGLGMVEGVMRALPTMRVGHIGLQREHDTLEPVDYYFKLPPEPEARTFIVVDPMLATGGTAVEAVRYIRDAGATDVRFVCIVAAPEGVERMRGAHPEVPIFAAALDRELDDRGFIVPGLGDAGDRLFGT